MLSVFPFLGHSLFTCFTASVFCTMHIYFKRKARDWPQCNCGRLEEPALIIFKLLFRILGTYIASIRFRMKEMYDRNLITRVSTTRAFSD